MPATMKDVRSLLRSNPDGLTATQISKITKGYPGETGRQLRKMPDAYIDRWEGPVRGQYVAVWCVVVVPEDCPYPGEQVVAVRPGGSKAARAGAPTANKTKPAARLRRAAVRTANADT